jgi:hypothetical protein
VNRLACGKSTATNSSLLSVSRAIISTLRESRSSRAMKHGAGDATHAKGLGKFRPAILPPTYDLGKLRDNEAGIGGDAILHRRSVASMLKPNCPCCTVETR